MSDDFITLEEMRVAVKRAVDERGADFVYPKEWMRVNDYSHPTCVYYNEDGTPSCIIGLAISYLRPDVKLEEGYSAFCVLEDITTPEARTFAAVAQGRQDAGLSWGEAYDAAVFYTGGP